MRLGILQRFFRFLLPLLLLMLVAGCRLSEMAANRIVSAPNTHNVLLDEKTLTFFWKVTSFAKSNCQVTFLSVPVGPPEAKLKIAHLPAGDYHMKMESKFSTNRNGKCWLEITGLPQTNDCFSPLAEPATIIILHGYTLCKESMLPWAINLAQSGFRVILVDLRGHGQSTGAEISFGKHEVDDLTQLLDYLVAQHLCEGRVGVLGISYGATMGLHWAAHDSRVKTVVAIAPYNQPDEAVARFVKEMKIPVSQKTVRKGLVRAAQKMDLQWSDWSGETAMRQVKVPVLLIGGGLDTISRPEDIKRMKELAVDGSKTIEVPTVDHIVLGTRFNELSEPIKAWFQERLVGANTTIAQKTGEGVGR
ncbi:MAG: alpha/beta hydrolase [Pedosphaera sp.]|nr:alpha/beta hydrolase [Pedosphaera sp.]